MIKICTTHWPEILVDWDACVRRIAYVECKSNNLFKFLVFNEMKMTLGYNDTMSTYKIGHSVTC